MEDTRLIKRLERKGVKPTANRMLVLKELEKCAGPVTLPDLETRLLTMDKSSIFRVLTLFSEHDVVDSFEDGRGVVNYDLCESERECDHEDSHIHFYCETCHQSFCLRQIPLAEVKLPEGFHAHSISFVIKGECPECRRKHGL